MKEQMIIVSNEDDTITTEEYHSTDLRLSYNEVVKAIGAMPKLLSVNFALKLDDEETLNAVVYCRDDEDYCFSDHKPDNLKANGLSYYLYNKPIYSNLVFLVPIPYDPITEADDRGFTDDEVKKVKDYLEHLLRSSMVKQLHQAWDYKRHLAY